MITLADFAATLANTTKPLIGPGVVHGAEADAIVAMARALRGPNLSRYPPCVPFICPITPLRFPAALVDALTVVARAGLPLEVIANPVMGVTAPYSIAGTVALGHAEVLAAAAMAHAVRPGLPILNGNTPSVADMRTLASTTGGPETGLIRRTVAELRITWACLRACMATPVHRASSFQAGDEKALNTLLLASARPSILGGLGGLANVTVGSYEMLVLDDERLGAVRRVLAGVTVDDDHLGLDVIAHWRCGRRLPRPRTHVAAPAQHGSVAVAARFRAEDWSKVRRRPRGSVDRARATARRIHDTHTVAPLPANIQRRHHRDHRRVRARVRDRTPCLTFTVEIPS